jgi:hypothetical protein
VNDILTLANAAAEYRRLAGASANPDRRAAYLELALVLETALDRLGISADVAEIIAVGAREFD